MLKSAEALENYAVNWKMTTMTKVCQSDMVKEEG
jgi:hypothetical protein